jgi:hypothetical protein
VSVWAWGHATHASPPKPQAESERELQIVPEQHPPAQVSAQPEHTPLVHVSGAGHVEHALPPLPHAAASLPAWHWLFRQQPLGHETPSHAHVPFKHRVPAVHAAPPPHVQEPAVHLSAEPAGHAIQAVPAGMHELSENAVHVIPVQQPSGHEVASQTHLDESQRSPGPHDASAPQLHTPLPEQLSALPATHVAHVPPSNPQLLSPGDWHRLFEQQLAGHDTASHRHLPPVQRCPPTHSAPVPQVQSPFAEHPSASAGSHTAHAAPPPPQVVVVGGEWQVVPEQHPFGQTHVLQAPPVHVSPGPHAPHAWPAFPHSVTEVPGSHTVPSQQPLAHDVASHVHCPPTQC